jgi:DNA-binding transcriptional ArsR family regulator
MMAVMRALMHPAMEEFSVEGILHALSDPVRAAIYADIVSAGGPLTCSSFLSIQQQRVPKSTLSQHFKALREAGLIRSERRGVQMHNTSRCSEVDKRFPGLVASIMRAHKLQSEARARRLARRRGPKRAVQG